MRQLTPAEIFRNKKRYMKIAKLLIAFMLIGGAVMLANCGKKCKGQDPQARIINNGTKNVSVQIKTSNGNTVNINNVAPGTSSPYVGYAAGSITFTISVNSVPYVQVVQMSQCYDYDIAIDSNNVITTKATDRNS